MRETDFIKKNRKKWKQYERALEHDQQDPELLRQLYIHTIDDLSYSRTYYPNRSVRVYLNGLAQRTFLQIYRGRRGETSRFFTFWTDELPRVVFARRRALGLALVVFVLAMLIGIISYRIDPAFAELIMGEYYMDMTRANIEGGDPMAVYKKRPLFRCPWPLR
jgi:preprotein translocase subunit SecE